MVIRHVKIENFRGIKSLDWHISSGLVCIIGRGDSCKTTFLEALEICLSPSQSSSPDDLDFHNINSNEPISIQVTIGGFDDSPEIDRVLLSESAYGLYQRGYSTRMIHDEPTDGTERVLTVEYTVDTDMEVAWKVIAPGRLEAKPIRRIHLEMLGVAKLGTYSDWHFSWSRNSMVARLSGGPTSVASELSTISRKLRAEKIDIEELDKQALSIEALVKEFGVKTSGYSPKLDAQSLVLKSGGISLHDGDIPIKRYGTGTKRLIALALQAKIQENKSIRLIDEFEYGLEPYRITNAINKISTSGDQCFISTHSPVVIRECGIEQIVVFHNENGTITPVQLAKGLGENEVNSLQGALRTHAESFLSEKIIVCEGQTEFGLARSLSAYKLDNGGSSFSSTGTAVLNAGGVKKCAPIAEQLKTAGYKVAIFCDADESLTTDDADLEVKGIKTFKWSGVRFTEQAIYEDLSQDIVVSLIESAISNVGTGTVLSSLGEQGISGINPATPGNWDWDNRAFRQKVAIASSKGNWHKRISYGQRLGEIIYANKVSSDEQTNFYEVMEGITDWYK